MPLRNDRAYALVVTLMITIVIAMMLGASLALSPGRLARAGNTSDQALAEGAVEAGIEYARAKLQEDPQWKGDANRVIVNQPTLYIEEQEGMVIGLMRPDESVPFSMFRIRFNFYNGGATADILDDNLPNPPARFLFDLPAVSVNNLDGGVRFLPIPDSTNVVDNFQTGLLELAPGTVALTVEGFGGDGLNRVNPSNFEPPAGSRHITHRVADVILAAAFVDGAPDAAMMGGGNLNFTLPIGSGKVKISASGATPRARTKGSVLMNAGGGSSTNYVSSGELLYDSIGGSETVAENAGTSVGDDGGQPFYELEWADIHKASTDPSEAVHIPGGTYVFDDSGDLHYFDLSWADYKAHVAARVAGAQDPFDHGLNTFDSKKVNSHLANIRTDSMASGVADLNSFRLKFEKDVRVNPSASGVADFTLVPQRGTNQMSTDNSDETAIGGSKFQKDIEFELKPKGNGKVAFTTQGDTLIASKIISDKGGSVVSGGDLRLDAGELDKFGRVGVSFYSQKDLSISTYEPQGNKYLSVGVSGLLYSWNDFNLRTGEAGMPVGKWEKVNIKGAAIAYGTDNGPSVEPPGTNSGGNFSVTAKEAEFRWDSAKMGDLLDMSKFGKSIVLKRASYIRR
jgi:hypothetical protein